MDELTILSKTIADHARKQAWAEWVTQYEPSLVQIICNAGLAKSTLEVDGRQFPIEVITIALKEQFVRHRISQLLPQLTQAVVETAFKKVIEEGKS